MSDLLRLGVMGASRIARDEHLRVGRIASGVEVVALASRSQATADSWAAELGIPAAYGSYEALLDDPNVDAVIITVPNSLHHQWAIAAAQAGKHILLEKPFAMTESEAQDIVDAAALNDVIIMEAFTTHFTPAMPVLRERIARGDLGTVFQIRAELRYNVSDWNTDSRVRADLGGGSLYDAGCYAVNLIRMLFDAEPIGALATERIRASHGVDASFAGTMLFDNDRYGIIVSSQESPGGFPVEVVGTRGRILVPAFYGKSMDVLIDGEARTESLEVVDRFRLQLEHFAECVRDHKQPATLGPEISVKGIAALHMLKQAASTSAARVAVVA